MIRVFSRKRTQSATNANRDQLMWPEDSLVDIDDEAFARAIEEGRRSEERLVA
jgi:hypothetical protein